MNNEKDPNNKDRKERKPTNPFDRFFNNSFNQSHSDIFDIFEEQIRRMQQEMNMFNQNNPNELYNKQFRDKPLIYGWSYHVGPDGKPHYQEFSNDNEKISQYTPKPPELQAKKDPFIDVIDAEKEIYITAEIPGVDKENIDVELTKDSLLLTVNHPERGVKKEIDLPAEISRKPVEAKYNNGVLSITLKKRKNKKKGNKINID